MKKVFSTVAPHCQARKIDEFDAERTIKCYEDIGLNVQEYFNDPIYNLFECTVTGYRFYHPSALLGDSSFYEDLSRNRKNYYSDRWEHMTSLKFINKEDLVLEVGSGFGSFLSQLKKHNIEARGIELNPHAVEYCTQLGLKVENKIIEKFSTYNKEKYDVVCSFQVLEHIYDVHSFLKNQIDTLKSGGNLIVGVPNNNPFLFINDKYHTLNLPPHHAGLWNKKSLKSLEKIFPLKLNHLIVEPMDISYVDFIQHQKINSKQVFLKKGITIAQRHYPNILKKIICHFFKGRNLLAVYSKS